MRFTSTETVRTIKDAEPRAATSTFTQLLSSDNGSFNVTLRPRRPCGPIRDREPRTSIRGEGLSESLPVLNSPCTLCGHKATLEEEEENVHLDLHTFVHDTLCNGSFFFKCCFTSKETIRTIRDGSPGRPPRFSHSS